MPHLGDYELYLIRQGLRVNTITKLLKLTKRIHQFVCPLTSKNFNSWIITLKIDGRKHSYLNALITAMNRYAEFLGDPSLGGNKRFPEEDVYKATLSDQEIESILSLKPLKKGFFKKRFEMQTFLLSILAYTGMRPGEVSRLMWEDVDIGRQVLIVRQSKTGQPRNVPIPQMILEQFSQPKAGLIFTNQYGRKWDPESINYIFKQRLKRLGINRKGLTLYSLRHSFCTRNVAEMDLFSLQSIVGHKKANTTQQYVHLNTEKLQKAIQKDPMARKSLTSKQIIKQFMELIKQFDFIDDERFSTTISESKAKVKIEISW